MLKDSKFSSHLLHLSELQVINHKTLDEYRERLKTYEVRELIHMGFDFHVLGFTLVWQTE